MTNFTTYATLADVRGYQLLDADQTDDDRELAGFLATAQEWIDILCRWSFQNETRTAEERYYPDVKVDGDGYLNIRVDKCPVQTVTSVAYRFRPMDGWTSVASNLVELYPLPATANRPLPRANLIKCYTGLGAGNRDGARVQVTYSGGFTGATPPASLNWLCAALAAHLYRSRAAGGEKTVFPQAGAVVIPGGWPQAIKNGIRTWSRVA